MIHMVTDLVTIDCCSDRSDMLSARSSPTPRINGQNNEYVLLYWPLSSDFAHVFSFHYIAYKLQLAEIINSTITVSTVIDVNLLVVSAFTKKNINESSVVCTCQTCGNDQFVVTLKMSGN